MNWIQLSAQTQAQRFRLSESLKLEQYKKFTIFDHNYTSVFDYEQLKFQCVFNCKRLNRQFSTLCTVEGDLMHNQIRISCSLVSNLQVIGGKWHYQKIQLLRFALKYNERSFNNIAIQVNPISGQICVCLNFMISPLVMQQPEKLREVITEQAKAVGEQSEKIFNTIIQIIFCKQADQPYLKSPKASAAFPSHIKVQKLLDKIKPLISTSNRYQLIKQISKPHRHRSYFKKLYLPSQAKTRNNPDLYQYARGYQVKFHQKFEQTNEGQNNRAKNNQFIKTYQQLQEKYEIEFAKHLKIDVSPQASYSSHINFLGRENIKVNYDDEMMIVSNGHNQQKQQFHVQEIQPNLLKYQFTLLKFMKFKHPNIVNYYKSQNFPNLRITEPKTIPLQEYLKRNKQVIGLSSKLSFMGDLCHVVNYLHSEQVLFFVKMQNIVIGQNLVLKLRDLSKSIIVMQMQDGKKDQIKNWKPISEELKLAFNDAVTKQVIQTETAKKIPEKQFPYISMTGWKRDQSTRQKINTYSLGVALYKILFQKFPFYEDIENVDQMDWEKLWVVDTESFLQYGGQIIKLLASLLLKCLHLKPEYVLTKRPFIQWLTVIVCQVKYSSEGIF